MDEKRKSQLKKHISKLDQIRFQPRKEFGSKIRSAAESSGLSIQSWISKACEQKLAKSDIDLVKTILSADSSLYKEETNGMARELTITSGSSEIKMIFDSSGMFIGI